MGRILIEDTARNNLASWTCELVSADKVAGGVVNAFSSTPVATTSKPAAERTLLQIRESGGETWFDAMTHALYMPNTGDFRNYEKWDLWEDPQARRLTTRAQRLDHVQRVFAIQDQLEVPHLAPTTLAISASGNELALMVDLMETALDLDPDCRLSLCGTSTFWSGGSDLDALVGTLAQMDPGGWFVSAARETSQVPTVPTPGEITGLCRTVRSLSAFAEVHLSHGDLAGLPGIAAGGHSLGTGWDARQRVLSYANFQARTSSPWGGWFKRPTFQGLLAVLSRSDAEMIFNDNRPLAQRLFVGHLHPDGPKEAFNHHIESLANVLAATSDSDFRTRYQALVDLMLEAIENWRQVSSLTDVDDASDDWIRTLLEGVQAYGQTEGW